MKFLYRYRSVNDNALRIFSHGELYFPSPKDFNDPFDCKVDFDFENCTDDDIRTFFIKAKEHHSIRNIEDGLRDALHDPIRWQHQVKEAAKEQLQPEIDKMGVLSFSENNDDILMWSHYADKHHGFCLVFDKERLSRWEHCFCKPVIYSQEYPTFREFYDAFPDNNGELIRLLILKKSPHWGYECEWRSVVNFEQINASGRSISMDELPDDLVTKVIFGCNMDSRVRERIKVMARRKFNKIQFHEAFKKGNEFALAIRPCE